MREPNPYKVVAYSDEIKLPSSKLSTVLLRLDQLRRKLQKPPTK